MRQFTINLPQWKDITQWFWDKFCFPRRKLIREWLDYHNDKIASATERVLLKYQGIDLSKNSFEELSNALNDWHKECDAITEKTEQLIMRK